MINSAADLEHGIPQGKRIGIITPARFPGTAGDTANYSEIINELRAQGYEITLVCPKIPKEKDKRELLPGGFEIVRIPYPPPRLEELKNGITGRHYIQLFLFLFTEFITILNVISTRRIRSVYMRHGLLTMHVPLLLKLFRVRVIADGELFSESLEKSIQGNAILLRLLRSYELKTISLYTYFKVSTQHQAERLTEIGFPSEKILVIPMSINIDKIPKYPIEEIQEHTFGYFGALEAWQGVDLLISSFQLLLEKIPSAILYVIGDGSMRNVLQEQITKANLANNVILVGSLPRERIWKEYFNKFRILVIPRPRIGNSIDTLPSIKLVEGLAGGKVVITTDIPAMKEVPIDSIAIVPAGDATSLARKMELLSKDAYKLMQYSKAASIAASTYDIRKNIRNITSHLLDG